MKATTEYRVLYGNGELSCSIFKRVTMDVFAELITRFADPIAIVTIRYKPGFEKEIDVPNEPEKVTV